MDVPELILSSDLARLGQDARDLARKAKSGQLRRIRQGVYVRAQDWEALAPWDRYPLLIRAAAATLKSRTVFCRQSSGVLWDMPVLGLQHPVHACTSDAGGGRSRAGVRRLVFRIPLLQVEVRDGRGLVAFTDFDWPEERLCGEFDGLVKYRNPEYLRGRTPAQALADEKRREDRIRATGRRVVRWTWSELSSPAKFAAFLAAAGAPRATLPSCRR